MNKDELSALVAEILAGMGEAPQVKAGPYKPENTGPQQREDGGSAEDVSAIDLRKLYLTKEPQKGEEFFYPTLPSFLCSFLGKNSKLQILS